MRTISSAHRTGSVSQDWRSPLSAEKSVTYLHTLRLFETSYAMFSINLDEALGLRRIGRLDKAYMALSITPALCKRLANHVQILLRALLAHAKNFRTTPNISPLNPENFQQPVSRRAAHFNRLCSRIVLSQRSQFLHKISTLLELIEDLDTAYPPLPPTSKIPTPCIPTKLGKSSILCTSTSIPASAKPQFS